MATESDSKKVTIIGGISLAAGGAGVSPRRHIAITDLEAVTAAEIKEAYDLRFIKNGEKYEKDLCTTRVLG